MPQARYFKKARRSRGSSPPPSRYASVDRTASCARSSTSAARAPRRRSDFIATSRASNAISPRAPASPSRARRHRSAGGTSAVSTGASMPASRAVREPSRERTRKKRIAPDTSGGGASRAADATARGRAANTTNLSEQDHLHADPHVPIVGRTQRPDHRFGARRAGRHGRSSRERSGIDGRDRAVDAVRQGGAEAPAARAPRKRSADGYR